MKVLVVTGGIGSGKSSVCRILNENFALSVYDADYMAKQLYIKDVSLLTSIENTFGKSLRDEYGDFSPRMLSEIIFKDTDALSKVEELLFPVLLDDFNSWMSSCSGDWVVFESATILEKPFFTGFGDVLLLVDAPISLRKERAMLRDNTSDEYITTRMNCQKLMNHLSEGGTDERIDYVVKNDSTISELESRINLFWNKIHV